MSVLWRSYVQDANSIPRIPMNSFLLTLKLPEVCGLSPEEVGPESPRGPVHPQSSCSFVAQAQDACTSSVSTLSLGGASPPLLSVPVSPLPPPHVPCNQALAC